MIWKDGYIGMAVKMRLNKVPTACSSCGGEKGKGKVKEMYDICFGRDIFHLCQLCMGDLLRLTCKANSDYHVRLKNRNEVH